MDARAADGLERGVYDALDTERLVQGRERDHRLDGGAVGVGYDALGMLERVLGIDLGDHERHLVVHAPVSGVIDDDAARRREHGGVYAAGLAARAHDDDLARPLS